MKSGGQSRSKGQRLCADRPLPRHKCCAAAKAACAPGFWINRGVSGARSNGWSTAIESAAGPYAPLKLFAAGLRQNCKEPGFLWLTAGAHAVDALEPPLFARTAACAAARRATGTRKGEQ